MTSWTVSRDRILTATEIKAVLADLTRKARRSPLTRRSLIIFRLACCCGLRASELNRLTLANVRLSSRPAIRVPASIGKGGKARTVPLNWDAGTLADLTAWKSLREVQGASANDLFICTKSGGQIDRRAARKAFQAACRVLDRPVTIHDGRHSFVSHALHAGRTVVEAREAAGHSTIATTSIYAHLVEDDGTVGNLFG